MELSVLSEAHSDGVAGAAGLNQSSWCSSCERPSSETPAVLSPPCDGAMEALGVSVGSGDGLNCGDELRETLSKLSHKTPLRASEQF